MNYTGKWKIDSMMVGIGDEFVSKKISDLIAECNDDDELRDLEHQRDTLIEIRDNGKLYFLMPLPASVKDMSQDEILALMKEEGLENVILKDTHFTSETEAMEWEMRGDDLYVKTNMQGCNYDDDGNEVPLDPWEKWSIDGSENIRFFTAEYTKL